MVHFVDQMLNRKCAEYGIRNSTWGTTSWSTCPLMCSERWPSFLNWLSVETAWRQWMETCSPICLVQLPPACRLQTHFHCDQVVTLNSRVSNAYVVYWRFHLVIFLFRPLSDLNKLHLHDNMWQCDCNIASLVRWMGQTKATLSPRDALMCVSPPELRKKSLSSLQADKLSCHE